MAATGFMILEGDNLSNIFPGVVCQIGEYFSIGGKQSFVIMVSLIILPTVWLKDLSLLSVISGGGVLATLILLCSIFWNGAFDGIGFHEKGTLVNWKGIPTAISLFSLSYCAHPVFSPIYTSMSNRKQYSKVMIVSFFSCTVFYALVAILGYLMFGSKVLSQITLNLPVNKISSKVAIYTTLVNPIAKYALLIMPTVNALEDKLIPNRTQRSFSIFIRSCLVFSTVIVALAMPFFGEVMSLSGAFVSVTSSIVLPCLCFLKISGIYGRFGLEQLLIGGIVLVGILSVLTGTYTSSVEIVRHYYHF
ncbi:OLC1v1009578C1 [Oldenlandia corymbosa var. corymbosa]|uniref:OLC1v1009578C1 n=1 Tax=Oldenlandia corymbosa var. corymbosa TaxID=529605 RepID=A0AAV1DRY6_OLDCO|nr:OLC1v1009578C1 [Oldenlandia corymbosa var. corymbosa]